jgi:hypothetical protein
MPLLLPANRLGAPGSAPGTMGITVGGEAVEVAGQDADLRAGRVLVCLPNRIGTGEYAYTFGGAA